MDDWILWATVGALLGIFIALMVMAGREDLRKRQGPESNTWILTPSNPTDDAYERWLMQQDISTWPYEPAAGYDERKEGSA